MTDFIGIKVCSTDPTPESGLYINSLPGISLEMMDKSADQEQITYRGVWDDAQVEAGSSFGIDFFNELLKCFAIQPYCDYEALICANKTILAVAWKYLLGAKLMEYRMYTARLNYFTSVSRDEAKELLAHYQVEYETALSKAVKLIDVSSCCLECGGSPEVVMWIP